MRGACRSHGARVTGGEIDSVDTIELGPWKRIVRARRDTLADHGDRALRGVVEVDEPPPLRLRAPRGLHADSLPLELALRRTTEVIVAERGQEQALAGESRELDRRYGSAAGRFLPRLARVDDLAGSRRVVHAREFDPLDMPDDRDLHCLGIIVHRGW